jgi:XRE family transcriptional regulator, regulator of sulfur utilization
MSSDRSELLVSHVVAILKDARLKKQLSINQLAWMSGVSAKGIAFIEQGKNSPTLRSIYRIADALELPVPKLFAAADKAVLRKEGDLGD